MISDKLVRVVKGTLDSDLTDMQTEILKGVLIMFMNSICYDVDLMLSHIDKSLRG